MKKSRWLRWVQFFEGAENRMSMTRLLAFMSFFPSSIALMKNPTDAAMGWYLSAFVIQLIGGKAAEAYAQKGKPDAPVSNEP